MGIVATAPARPSGFRPRMPCLFCQNHIKGSGPMLRARRPDITMSTVDAFLSGMYRTHAHSAVDFLAGEEEPER